MFVQAIDRKLYKNPTIIGEGWYIKFSDTELPEVILKSENRMTEASGKRAIKRVLAIKGIDCYIKEQGTESLYPFPPDWKKLESGFSWNFVLKKSIPIPTIFDAVIDYPPANTPYLAWELEFPIEDIYAYFIKKESRPILTQFITGKMFHNEDEVRRKMLVRVYKQLEGLKRHVRDRVSLADLESTFGKTIILAKPEVRE